MAACAYACVCACLPYVLRGGGARAEGTEGVVVVLLLIPCCRRRAPQKRWRKTNKAVNGCFARDWFVHSAPRRIDVSTTHGAARGARDRSRRFVLRRRGPSLPSLPSPNRRALHTTPAMPPVPFLPPPPFFLGGFIAGRYTAMNETGIRQVKLLLNRGADPLPHPGPPPRPLPPPAPHLNHRAVRKRETKETTKKKEPAHFAPSFLLHHFGLFFSPGPPAPPRLSHTLLLLLFPSCATGASLPALPTVASLETLHLPNRPYTGVVRPEPVLRRHARPDVLGHRPGEPRPARAVSPRPQSRLGRVGGPARASRPRACADTVHALSSGSVPRRVRRGVARRASVQRASTAEHPPPLLRRAVPAKNNLGLSLCRRSGGIQPTRLLLLLRCYVVAGRGGGACRMIPRWR